MIKSIAKSKVELFEKKLHVLNSRQSKYNLPLTIAKKVGTHIEEIEFTNHVKGDSFRDDQTFKRKVVFVDYDIDNLEIVKKDGSYTYLGERKIRDGVPFVFCVDDQYVDEVSKEVDICDHCHIQRKRNKYHVFKNEDGKIIRVGSTCCKDYFGYDVEKFLNCYLETFQVINEGLDCDDLKADIVFDWDSIYEATRSETNEFSSWIREDFTYKIEPPKRGHQDRINEIKDYWDDQNGDFAFNCRNILNEEYVTIRNLTMAYSAIFFGEKGLKKMKEIKVIEQPTFEKDEKIQISGVVEKRQFVETLYGGTYLIIINSSGVLYKTFTTSKDMVNLHVEDEVVVNATFKEVDRFGGKIFQNVKKPKLVFVKEKVEEIVPGTNEADKALDELMVKLGY